MYKSLDVLGYPLYSVNTNGEIINNKSGRILIQHLSQERYYNVGIYNNGEYKRWLVHRIVAIVFIPNPNNCSQVNHKDGNKLNNHIDNLEWCTGLENVTHARNVGLRIKTITDDMINVICKKLQDGGVDVDIANEFGVPIHTVRNIKYRNAHKHISDNYNITDNWSTKSISDDKCHEICKYLEQGLVVSKIVTITGVHYPIIREIIKKKSYKYISDKYNILSWNDYPREREREKNI